MLAVLRRLYAEGFPIRRMVPVDAYGGSDYRSIEADNTSAFNCRYVDGTTRWSEHAYGRAIDVNPIENPYVTSAGTTSHPASRPYLSADTVPPGHGGRGPRARRSVRRGRLGLGRPLVGREGLPALLRLGTVGGCQADIRDRPLPLTWLFVPADRPDRVEKALASDAHAVIVDLEDGVAPEAKEAARGNLAASPRPPAGQDGRRPRQRDRHRARRA